MSGQTERLTLAETVFINQVLGKEERRCVVIHTSVKGKGKQQSETTHAHILLMAFSPLTG